MKHLQTYLLTRQEHASLKSHPYLLTIGPSDKPQVITLAVEPGRNGNGHAVSTKSPVTSAKLSCEKCGAKKTVKGEPFTNQSIAAHRFKVHGIKRKGGAK